MEGRGGAAIVLEVTVGSVAALLKISALPYGLLLICAINLSYRSVTCTFPKEK